MKEKEPWDKFMGSGKIEDYLLYAGTSESPDSTAAGTYAVPSLYAAGINSTPELGVAGLHGIPDKDVVQGYGIPHISTADMVAMNNAGEYSGIGGMNTFGINNLPGIARQEEVNGYSAVEDTSNVE